MKLLKCHIVGFGNWKNKTIDFQGGLTSVCEKNGFGKSSLASFIRAMFYGLERVTKANNERKRALPFDGSPCGGSLDFEWEGNQYSIERSFIGKTPKDDTLICYKNGIETKELGEVPGNVVFGLDLDSFNRTIFISPTDLEISSSETLNAKMSHFVEGSSDGCDFSSVKESLEELKKKYKPQKNAETKGLLAIETSKINDLEMQETNLSNMKAAMPAKYEKLQELDKNISINQEKNKKAVSHNALIKSWENYDREKEKIDEKEKEIRQLKEKYPLGMISLAEETSMKGLLEQYKLDGNTHANLKLSIAEKEEYDNLKLRFEEDVPTPSFLNELQELVLAYSNEKSKEPLKLSIEESSLIRLFDGRKVNLESLEKRMVTYRSLKKEYDKEPDQISVPIEQKKISLKAPLIFGLSLFILFSIVAILLGIFIHPGCYSLFALSVVSLLIPAVYYFNEKKKRAAMPTTENQPNLRKKEMGENLTELKINLSSTFKAFAVDENELEGSFALFKAKYDSYLKTLQHEKDLNKTNEQNRLSCLAKEKTLQEYFSRYHYKGNDYANLLMNLSSDTKKYLSYVQKEKQIEEQRKELENKIHEEGEKIKELAQKYNMGDPNSYLNQLPIDRNALQNKEKELTKQKEDLALFKEKEHLTERPSSLEGIDLNALSKELEKAINDRQALSSQIEEDERNISSLEDEVSSLSEEKDNLAKLKKDYEIVSKTLKALTDAEESLKRRYISPVENQFKKYSQSLENALGEEIEMDTDFNVSFIRDGKRSGAEYLSSGEMTLCALAYRLAITDNIFEGKEKPFLILDDIFADLDETHIHMAKKFMESLSQNEQILYFTCHPSRDMK